MSNRESRAAIVDLLIVGGLAAVYVVSEAAAVPKRWIFCALAAALLVYAWVAWRRGGETLADFGLRTDNLAESARPIGAWTAACVLGIVGWAIASGRSLWRSDLAILLPLYPLFGVAQQLVFQGVVHRRLMTLIANRNVTVGITAVAFALVHAGDWRLVVLAGLAGAVWSAMFQRWPNVWLLGLSHGILAALAYPLILGEQPLTRI